jgi:alkylhydroperoxidase family enzyme
LARRHGATQEDLDALKTSETWDTHFKSEEAAALRLADAITLGNGHVTEDVWNAVAAHYDEGQLIELVGVIGLFNYFNRFNNALEIEVTRPGWPAK